MLNRRDTLRGLALAVGVASTGWAERALAAAAPAPALTWAPKALTVDQARLLDVVAELIIPATDTPGARLPRPAQSARAPPPKRGPVPRPRTPGRSVVAVGASPRR